MKRIIIVGIYGLFLILLLSGCETNNNNKHNHEYIDGICSCGDKLEQTYKVSFVDYDGKVLKQQEVKKNESASSPTDPVRDGYTFIGWSNEFNNITSDLILVAQYQQSEINNHKHSYIDGKCECGETLEVSDNLIYELSDDRTYYVVVGSTSDIYDHIVVPSTYNDLPVKSIESISSSDSPWITEVTLSEGITRIEEGAFNWFMLLENVNLPNSLEYIGDYSFSDCPNLRNIYIPKNVSFIGEDVFGDETVIKSIDVDIDNQYYKSIDGNLLSKDGKIFYQYAKGRTALYFDIPKGVEIISERAFADCLYLKTINVPDSTISIGDYAFRDCYNLTTIRIADSVTSIGSSAFYKCRSLTSIVIPDSVTSIGSSAFSYCSSLTSVTIGINVTSIGSSAFTYCSLTSIVIPDSVTSIGSCAFENCSSLTSIVIPDSVTSIDSYTFNNCSSLTSIVIPDSVTSIGSSAFYNCSSLTSIVIPNSVTSIGNSTFENCDSLTSIVIPNSVTSIGNSAFFNCYSLTIHCEALSKPTDWHNDWNYSNCPVVWGYTE